ncbi:MAG: HAMP domain-containing protein, partial [Thermonemataceae bacterium]|nr:HAMP domain-containing protein [Thermonemataceae bacterium]
MSKKAWSIRKLTTYFFAAAVGLVLLSFLMVYVSSIYLRRDAAKVEISRKAEKTLGQVPFRAGLVIGGNKENKTDLQNLIMEYDDYLDILSKGRSMVIFTNEIQIEPTTKGTSKIKLNKLLDDWNLYKRNLNIILNEVVVFDTVVSKLVTQTQKVEDTLREIPIAIKEVEKIDNPNVQKAYFNLVETTKPIQNLHNELTTLYIAGYTGTQQGIQILIFFIILTLIVFLVAGYFYLRNRFISPLNSVAAVTQEVASGDVSQKILYDRQDEIGVLATNINALISNLKKTSEFAKNIGEGRFNYAYQVRSEKDILGYALLDMRENLLKVAEEDRRRKWANDGFELFVNILRSNYENINDLAYKIISNLVKYL